MRPIGPDEGDNSGAEPSSEHSLAVVEPDDPLGDLLRNRAGAHEELGEPIPDALMLNGAMGAGLLCLAAIVFMLLPDPDSMRGGGFLVLGDATAANITEAGKGMAVGLLGLGALLLALDGLLATLKPRLPVEAHYAYAGQLGLGACAAVPTGVTLAILLLSVVIWAAVIALCLFVLSLFAQ